MKNTLLNNLWKIYHRPDRPEPFSGDSDLFWSDPDFSERILEQHLDDSNGAASRPANERAAQLVWLWDKLGLQPAQHVFDVTCGPGLFAVELARYGCTVTGIDFSPASIDYAQDLVIAEGMADKCHFVEQDIRKMDYSGANFDAAILLYGQLAVFRREEAQAILEKIAQALKPGARLCLELLDQAKVDKTDSSWWFTDDSGLWDDAPYLHLGERFWFPEDESSIERYQIIHLTTGELTKIHISDQTYAVETMISMLHRAGFSHVDIYMAWDQLPVIDAEEWVAYVATK
ncbi:MAG: class I SAM-dependent methyltransferase [Anaerolineae bacterium]|nr:class I SAM-dependent methyltransferase [Anaerolineae bacterium]